MIYRKELEKCFRVVREEGGKVYQIWPKGRPRQKPDGHYLPRPDHLRTGISQHPPGSAERIADLTHYYETMPEQSAFDTDLAHDLVSLLDWSKRKENRDTIQDSLKSLANQQHAEREE